MIKDEEEILETVPGATGLELSAADSDRGRKGSWKASRTWGQYSTSATWYLKTWGRLLKLLLSYSCLNSKGGTSLSPLEGH